MQNFFYNGKVGASKILERLKMTTPAQFVRQVKQEVSKITWPSRSDALRGTLVVIVACVILAALLVFIDFVFATAVGAIVGG